MQKSIKVIVITIVLIVPPQFSSVEKETGSKKWIKHLNIC